MEEHNSYSDVTPEIVRLAELSREAGVIDSELFTKYDVKRGLRDLNGKGVLAGLTNISDVRATKWWMVNRSPVMVTFLQRL